MSVSHKSHQATFNDFVTFCLYKTLTLFLLQNTLSGLPDSVSPQVQFLSPQINSFSSLLYFLFLVDIIYIFSFLINLFPP